MSLKCHLRTWRESVREGPDLSENTHFNLRKSELILRQWCVRGGQPSSWRHGRVSDHKDLKMPAVLSRVGPRASRSPVAMDEMFELFDNELLITDNAFHHVANRNYTNQSFTLEHREMAHCFGGHHSHTFLD